MKINTQNTKNVKNAITIPNLLTLQGILYKKLQLMFIVITWFIYGKHWLQYICEVKMFE